MTSEQPAENKISQDDMNVSIFYKGTSLTINRDMLRSVMSLLKDKGFQPEVSTEEILKQMDYFNERICKAHTDKADLNDHATFKTYFPGKLLSVTHLSVIWAMDVVTLLHRKVFKLAASESRTNKLAASEF